MPEKQNNKERIREITDSIEKGIQELFQSDKFANYLKTMSRFHKYSVNNTMLIFMQKPDATLVAGFNTWRDKFERNVIKAESISYAVCAYYGIETGENSFGYIAGWSKGKELKELRSSLETINKTSSDFICDIDRHYAGLQKERDAVIEVIAGVAASPGRSSVRNKLQHYHGQNTVPLSKRTIEEVR